jgi:hypothetical protein
MLYVYIYSHNKKIKKISINPRAYPNSISILTFHKHEKWLLHHSTNMCTSNSAHCQGSCSMMACPRLCPGSLDTTLYRLKSSLSNLETQITELSSRNNYSLVMKKALTLFYLPSQQSGIPFILQWQVMPWP